MQSCFATVLQNSTKKYRIFGTFFLKRWHLPNKDCIVSLKKTAYVASENNSLMTSETLLQDWDIPMKCIVLIPIEYLLHK